MNRGWGDEEDKPDAVTRPFKDWGHCVGDTLKKERGVKEMGRWGDILDCGLRIAEWERLIQRKATGVRPQHSTDPLFLSSEREHLETVLTFYLNIR